MSNTPSLEQLKQHEKRTLAAFLLYAAAIIGLLNLFATGKTTGAYTPLITIDIIVYVVMLVLTYLLQRRQKGVVFLYLILAIVWYLASVFFLPERFHHHLDVFVLMVQIALTLFAYLILWIKA